MSPGGDTIPGDQRFTFRSSGLAEVPGRKKKPSTGPDAVMFNPSNKTIDLENARVIGHDAEEKATGAEQGRDYLNIDDIDFDEEKKWQRPTPPDQVHGPSGEKNTKNIPDGPPGRSMHCPECGKVIPLPKISGPTVITCRSCGAKGRIRF